MHKLALILLGMASLAASGIITDRVRNGLDIIGGLGAQLQHIHGLHDIGLSGGVGLVTIGALNKQELMRQKFILDILQQVNQPLQKQELLMVINRNDVINEDLYMRPLTEEMLMVLDLLRQQQVLGKQDICTISNDEHIRQMVGLYRLLVTARDFETFKRLVIYGRQHINTEMFVNALILALAERDDTKMLVVPALHEILPHLYHQDSVKQQVEHLDTGVSTLKPDLVDIVGLGRPNRFLNPHWNTEQQQGGGLWGVWNRSQMWMPWRGLHRQLAMRRMMGGNVVEQNNSQMDKLVIQLPGQGLLTEDIGLKAYVNVLLDELIVKQDVVRNVGINTGRNMDISGIWGRRGSGNTRNRLFGLNKNDEDVEDNMQLNVNNQRRTMMGHGMNKNMDWDMDMQQRDVLGRRNIVESDNIMGSGRVGRVGLLRDDHNMRRGMWNMNRDNDDDDDDDVRQTIRNRLGGGQRGSNTVSVNDARLLFVGRRRKNPNNVINLGNKRNMNNMDDMEMISGGRRVDRNERRNEKEQQQRWKNNNRYDNDDDQEEQQQWNKRYTNRRNNLMNDDNMRMGGNQWQRQGQGQDQGIGSRGLDRDEFLNIVTRGNYGRRQMWQNDNDDDDDVVMQNRGRTNIKGGRHSSLDMNLPTTTIDDERLLHVNRRKLNDNVNVNMNERRSIWNNNNNNDDDDNIRNLNSWDIKRRNMLDDDDDDMIMMNPHLGRDIHTGGHRYRRSLDYQQVMSGVGDVSTNEGRINGKLLLQTLQQLVARLNVERIALGLPQLIDDQLTGIGRGGLLGNTLNQQQLTINRNLVNTDSHLSTQTVQTIEDIIQRIDGVLQQNKRQILSWSTLDNDYNDKLDQMGLMLAGQIQEIGLLDIIGDILKQSSSQLRKGQVANLIENENIQVLLAGIVKVIDENVQQIFKTRQDHISNVRDITINNVDVDKLQTYLEQTVVDLSNLSQDNIDLSVHGDGGKKKMIVGQVPRLNHKSFHIDIDVTSERQQQVVVRSLLVPKVDGHNNVLPLKQQRQNAILLDITTVNLKTGRNLIKLKSNDITLTSCDTTPYTKIYERVMRALEGETVMGHDQICGQTDLLPHRLLVPRGRVNGLPMQLVTVITPVQNPAMLGHSVTGLDVLLLDHLPLNYPLHCDITTSLEQIAASMANVLVKDVKIYHEDNIKMPLINNIMY